MKPERYPLFDWMRLGLALLVVLSHSFYLSSTRKEPLHELTGGAVTIGGLAVAGFFLLSGFVTTQSALLSSSANSFLWKRACRIVPGLLLVLPLSFCLPGFRNAPLWSIPYECAAYALLFVLMSLKQVTKPTLLVLFAMFLATYLATGPKMAMPAYGSNFLGLVSWLGTMYFAGSVAFVMRSRLPLAFAKKVRDMKHDFSYGVYIWHFAVLFFVRNLGVPAVETFVLALAGTLPVAFLSWKYVEKPALSLKNWDPRKQPRLAPLPLAQSSELPVP